MEEKKVSIVIPVYNVENYLLKCLDSVCNQNYKKLEIIVVDDGSTDNSGKICDEYAKKFKNVTVIHKKNGGITSAWLSGLEKVTGEFVTFVDSDDWIEQNSISKISELMQKYGCDVSIFDYYSSYDKFRIKEKGYNSGDYGYKTGKELENLKEDIVKNLNLSLPFFKWNKMFKTEIVMQNLKYNVQIDCFDDVIISLSSILDAKSVYVGNEAFVNYYQRQSSTTHKFNRKFLKEYLTYLDGLKKLLTIKNVYNEEFFIYEQARTLVFLFEQVFEAKLKDEKEIVRRIKSEQPFKDVVSSKYFSSLTLFRKKLLNYINKDKLFIVRRMVNFRVMYRKLKIKLQKKEKYGRKS